MFCLPINSLAPAVPVAGSYREYVRRPDQQVFSVLTGARHELTKDVITYDAAVSRGHNIGGQSFPTIYFSGPQNVTFRRRPKQPIPAKSESD